jgi:Uma2 family endonuclease
MATHPVRTRDWTRKEYEQLVELGVLHEDEPIELIGGQMIVAEPKNAPHPTAVGLTADALRAAFGPGWVVRSQDPVALDDESEPEPDVSVVPGRWRDYSHTHPERPALIVEVADSSIAFDRRYKGSLYARAGIADYWIVNVRRRVLEVYREPVIAPAARFGWKYDRVRILKPEATVSPLVLPGATIPVADLLP